MSAGLRDIHLDDSYCLTLTSCTRLHKIPCSKIVSLRLIQGCFPLSGIFRAQRNFSLFVCSQSELKTKKEKLRCARKIRLAENSLHIRLVGFSRQSKEDPGYEVDDHTLDQVSSIKGDASQARFQVITHYLN